MNTTYKDYDPEALKASYVMVGVEYAAPSPTNPRKTFAEAEMAELIESVKQYGVLQPILVRHWPMSYTSPLPTTTYEIVAGERRWRAAKAAGLTMLEAKFRDLTDLEVLEIQIIENLQRSDLHPLEEAEGYERIMGTHAYTAEQLAEKIGKSRSYIFGRLKLLALDDDARRLFRAGLLNASTALLIARIPNTALRAKAIKEITDPYINDEPMSVRQAHRHLQSRYMLKLSEAPFPLGAYNLNLAGSCIECPKRSGNVPDLFDDIDSPDVCTDPDCFVEKKLAFVAREAERISAAGGKVIVGKEAEKIAPHGIDKWTPLDDYTQMNKVCQADPEKRTYLEILGDDIDQVMIENTRTSTMVPVIPNNILAEKLEAAGVKLHQSEAEKGKAKVEGQLALERATRARLFEQVRVAAATYANDEGAGFAYGVQDLIFEMMINRLWERCEQDLRFKIANQWNAVGQNNTERAAAFGLGLVNLTTAERWLLVVDMLTINGVTVANEWDLTHGGKALNQMAETVFGINIAETRQTVDSEQKTKPENNKSGKKSQSTTKKTAKSTPDATPAEPSYPLEAAQAAVLTAENAAQAGDSAVEENQATPSAGADLIEMNEKPSPAQRTAPLYVHPNMDSLTWSGRGRKPAWVTAWLATEGNTLDMLKPNGKEEQSSASVEANAKPSVENDRSSPNNLKVGDCVKIRSTCKNWRMAGGEAVIKSVVRPGLYQATYGPLICDVSALVDTEIAEVMPAGHVPAWAPKDLSGDSDESDRTPTETEPVFAIGDRVRIKEGLKGPAGNRRKCCGREGVIEAVLYDGGFEVELDTGPVIVGANDIEAVGAPADRCDKTVDMFQGAAA